MLRKNDGLTLDIPSNSAALLSTSFPGQESQCPNKWGLKTNRAPPFSFRRSLQTQPLGYLLLNHLQYRDKCSHHQFLGKIQSSLKCFLQQDAWSALAILPLSLHSTCQNSRRRQENVNFTRQDAYCSISRKTNNKFSSAHWNATCLYVSLFAVFLVLPVMVNACHYRKPLALWTSSLEVLKSMKKWCFRGCALQVQVVCNAFHMCILHFWILGCKVQSGWIYVSPCKMHRNCWKYSKTSQFGIPCI